MPKISAMVKPPVCGQIWRSSCCYSRPVSEQETLPLLPTWCRNKNLLKLSNQEGDNQSSKCAANQPTWRNFCSKNNSPSPCFSNFSRSFPGFPHFYFLLLPFPPFFPLVVLPPKNFTAEALSSIAVSSPEASPRNFPSLSPNIYLSSLSLGFQLSGLFPSRPSLYQLVSP